MNVRLHKNATTTPRIRAEIRAAPPSVTNAELVRRYGVTDSTIARWRNRDSVEDRSHTPHNLNATLSPAQEEIVVEVRRTLLLPIDDLLCVVREFIEPKLSRSALDRCLQRHGVGSLKNLLPKVEREEPKRFKSYEPGYLHIDLKHLPKMSDEKVHQYLFVAIDRATRWVYLEIRPTKSAQDGADFLAALTRAAPMKIRTILTDNGGEFTDRFTPRGERTPTGRHLFDQVCSGQGIEHRLIQPWKPQTNGMVERFNGRITNELAATRFANSTELREGLLGYGRIYVAHIPQRVLGHRTPLESLRAWYETHPHLFRINPANLPGPDIYSPALVADPDAGTRPPRVRIANGAGCGAVLGEHTAGVVL
jgi:transposase-like protein